jgi:hypothetical protein
MFKYSNKRGRKYFPTLSAEIVTRSATPVQQVYRLIKNRSKIVYINPGIYLDKIDRDGRMNVTTAVKMMALLALLAGMSVAGVKYVAVVESDVDESSGASEKISRADVRLVTAELRREAVKNLPPKRYSIMTAETVQSMGGAVLEECAEENCVIALGSKIGADYIVRGTVSKMETRFTLQVEMYETENGTLVASCDPVRSESIGGLIEKAAEACGNMFKTWVVSQKSQESESAVIRFVKSSSIGGGAFFTSDLGGGLEYGNGEQIRMPYYGGGGYLFIDVVYAEVFAGYSMGGGKWKSADAHKTDSIPDMRRSYINIGVFAKYPFEVGSLKIFPLLGIDYESSVSGELVYDWGADAMEKSASVLWFKAGGGVDLGLGDRAYLRTEILYGLRTANEFEKTCRDKEESRIENKATVSTKSGHGGTVKIGAGVRF